MSLKRYRLKHKKLGRHCRKSNNIRGMGLGDRSGWPPPIQIAYRFLSSHWSSLVKTNKFAAGVARGKYHLLIKGKKPRKLKKLVPHYPMRILNNES